MFLSMQTTTPRQRPLNQNPVAVKRLRIAAGLRQVALAKRAKITAAHVSKIETGRNSAGPEVLGRLAKALGCPVEELMAEELTVK